MKDGSNNRKLALFSLGKPRLKLQSLMEQISFQIRIQSIKALKYHALKGMKELHF